MSPSKDISARREEKVACEWLTEARVHSRAHAVADMADKGSGGTQSRTSEAR